MRRFINSFNDIFKLPDYRDLLFISISFFTWGVGEGLFFYFQPIYLQELGANPVIIGSILGMSGIAMTLIQTPTGFLADRIGTRKVMIAGWVIGTLATAIMAFSTSLSGFSAGIVVYGLSAVNAATSSYITSARGKMSIARALTVVSASYHIGAFIGPVIGGGIGEKYGLHIIYRFSVVIFIISTLILLFTGEHARPQPASIKQRINIFQNRYFLFILLISFVTIFSGYLAEPLTPNYLQNVHNVTLSQMGKLGAIGSLGNATISLIFGGFHPFAGIFIGHAFLGIFAALMWQGKALTWFAVGYFLRGGYRIYQAMYLSLARQQIQSHEIGMAYGFLSTVNSIAIILAPPIAGMLYGGEPTMLYTTSLLLIAISLMLNIIVARKLPKFHY